MLENNKLSHFINEQETKVLKSKVLNRKLKSPKHSVLQSVEGYYQSDKDYQPKTTKKLYRQMFYETLDCLIKSL